MTSVVAFSLSQMLAYPQALCYVRSLTKAAGTGGRSTGGEPELGARRKRSKVKKTNESGFAEIWEKRNREQGSTRGLGRKDGEPLEWNIDEKVNSFNSLDLGDELCS